MKTLASIRRALRPGGRLVLVDFIKEQGKSTAFILEHVRADRQTVIKEVSAAGFCLVDAPNVLDEQYVLRFALPADKPAR